MIGRLSRKHLPNNEDAGRKEIFRQSKFEDPVIRKYSDEMNLSKEMQY